MKLPDADRFVSPLPGHEKLSVSKNSFTSEISKIEFPLVEGIPWLTPDPKRTLADWQNRSEALLSHLEENIAQMKSEMEQNSLADLTQERIRKTRLLSIRHLEYLKDLLRPLKLSGKMTASEATGWGYRLPAYQGLLGYFPNLIRDWGPDTGENQAQLKALEACLDKTPLGKLVVLGCGGGRLAYDLHQTGRTDETIGIDINPVLLLTSQRILKGFTVHLVEMPIAAKNLESTGMVHACRAPEELRDGFSLAFADCYHLPFASGRTDSVLTPWLIDILPRPFPILCQEINRVLKKGGVWLNTGSLNFQLRKQSDNLSLEEVRATAEEYGFKIEELKQGPIPYLQSSLSCHERTETITTFRARKVSDLEISTTNLNARPDWLLDPTQPIPVTQHTQARAVMAQVQSVALSLVDGKRSIDSIAAEIAARYGLPKDNAREAVANFFNRNFEESIFG